MFDPNLYGNYYSRAMMSYGQSAGNYLATGYDPMMLPNLGLMDRGSYYGNGPPVPLTTTVASFFTGGGAIPINHQPLNRAIEATMRGRRYMQGRGQFLTNQSVNQLRSIFTAINNQRGLADTSRGFRTVEDMLRSPVGQMALPIAYGMAPEQFEGLFGRAGSGIGMYDAAYNAATYRHRNDGTRWASDQYLQFAERAANRYYGSPEARAERMINSHQGGQLYTYLDKAGFLGAKNEYGDRQFTSRLTTEGLTETEIKDAVRDYALSNPIAANAPASVKRMHQNLNQRHQINNARRQVRNAASLVAEGPRGADDRVYEQNVADYLKGVDDLTRLETAAGYKTSNTQGTKVDANKMSDLHTTFQEMRNLKSGSDPLTSTRAGGEAVTNAMNLITELGLEQVAGATQSFDLNTMSGDRIREISDRFNSVKQLAEKQDVATKKRDAFKAFREGGSNLRTNSEYNSMLSKAYEQIGSSLDNADTGIKIAITNRIQEQIRGQNKDPKKLTEDQIIDIHNAIKEEFGTSGLGATELGVMVASQVDAGFGSQIGTSFRNAGTAGATGAARDFLTKLEGNVIQQRYDADITEARTAIGSSLHEVGLKQRIDLDLDTLPLDGLVDMGEAMLALQNDPTLQEWMRISGMLKQSEGVFSQMEKAVSAVRTSLATTGKSMEETVGILNEFAGGNLFGANMDTLAPTVRQTFLAAKELNMTDDQVVQHMSRSAQMGRAMGINSALNATLGYTDLNIRSGVANTSTGQGKWGSVSNEVASDDLSMRWRKFIGESDMGNSIAAMMRIEAEYKNGDDKQRKLYEGSRLAKHTEAIRRWQSSYEYIDKDGQTRRSPVTMSKDDALTMIQGLTGNWDAAHAYLNSTQLNQKVWSDMPDEALPTFLQLTTQNIGTRFANFMNMFGPAAMIEPLGLSEAEKKAVSPFFADTLRRSSVDMFNGQRIKEIDPNSALSRQEQLTAMFSRNIDKQVTQLTVAEAEARKNGTTLSAADQAQLKAARAMQDKLKDGQFRSGFTAKAWEGMTKSVSDEHKGLSAEQAIQEFDIQIGFDTATQKSRQRVMADQEAGLANVIGDSMSERLVTVLTRNSENFAAVVKDKKKELIAQGVAPDRLQSAAEHAAQQELRQGITSKEMIQAMFGLSSQFDPSGQTGGALNVAYNQMSSAGEQIVWLKSQIQETKFQPEDTAEQKVQKESTLAKLNEQLTAAEDWYKVKIDKFKKAVAPISKRMGEENATGTLNNLIESSTMLKGVWVQERVGNGVQYRLADPTQTRQETTGTNNQLTGRVQVQGADGVFRTNDSLSGFITLANEQDPNDLTPPVSTMYQLHWKGNKAYYWGADDKGKPKEILVDFNSASQRGLKAVGTKLVGRAEDNKNAEYQLVGNKIVQRVDAKTDTWKSLRDGNEHEVTTDSQVGQKIMAAAKSGKITINKDFVDRVIAGEETSTEKRHIDAGMNLFRLEEENQAKTIANRLRGSSDVEAQVDKLSYKEGDITVEFYAVRGATAPTAARLSDAERVMDEYYSLTDSKADKEKEEKLRDQYSHFFNEATDARKAKYNEHIKNLTEATKKRDELKLSTAADAPSKLLAARAEVEDLTQQARAIKAADARKLGTDLTAIDTFRGGLGGVKGDIETYFKQGETAANSTLATSEVLKSVGDMAGRREAYRKADEARIEAEARR